MDEHSFISVNKRKKGGREEEKELEREEWREGVGEREGGREDET